MRVDKGTGGVGWATVGRVVGISEEAHPVEEAMLAGNKAVAEMATAIEVATKVVPEGALTGGSWVEPSEVEATTGAMEKEVQRCAPCCYSPDGSPVG